MSTVGHRLHFFHERTYRPQPLEKFEQEAKQAAALGATHMYIGEIPKRQQEWLDHPEDPYPNWGMLLTSLFKLVVPEGLEEWLPTDYANSNLELLRQRSRILKGYGLKASLYLAEPFYLPEAAYRAHPGWRGPRCDHPRRSRDAYFSPCIDNLEIQAFYAQAMETLCREVEIDHLQIVTNDSGAGICWTTGLYNGPNGPSACRHIPLGQRLLTFLNLLQTAAQRGGGRTVTADLSSNIIGFKESETAMDEVWPNLADGQIVNERNREGKQVIARVAYGLYEHVRPQRNIPLPVGFLRQYDAACKSGAESVEILVRASDHNEYIRLMQLYQQNPPTNEAERMALLLALAREIAGSEHGAALLDSWMAIDRCVTLLRGLYLDNFVMMPLITQRLINRPLVPRPSLLTEEETAYYRPFLFQATTEEQAQDLMNIQGMDFIRGFSGTRMATLAMADALQALAQAKAALNGLAAENAAFALLQKRLCVFECLIRTLSHSSSYQEILDRTNEEEQPPLQTRWPIGGDDRLLRLNEITRGEIDNAYALNRLISGREDTFFVLAEDVELEDIFLLSPEISTQLVHKTEIMLRHLRDGETIYESNNR